MNKHLPVLIVLLGFGLVSCGDSRFVSVYCTEGDYDLKISFNKISRAVELELYFDEGILNLKSLQDTSINDEGIESVSVSKLDIDEDFYEFILKTNLTKPTRKSGQSYFDMYAEYQRRLDESEMKLKLRRDNLKLTSYVNNEVEEVWQCELIEKQI